MVLTEQEITSAVLVGKGLEGSAREIEEAWYREAESRLAIFGAGQIDTVPGEQELRVRFRK